MQYGLGRRVERRIAGGTVAAALALLGACGSDEPESKGAVRTADLPAGNCQGRTLDALDGSLINARRAVILLRVRAPACAPYLRVLVNGTVRPLPTTPPGLVRGGQPLVSKVEFMTASYGWLYGTRAYVTRDRGRRWRRVPIPGYVESLAVRQTAVVLIARRCAGNQSCSGRIWSSPDAGRSWTSATVKVTTAADRVLFGPMDTALVFTGQNLFERARGKGWSPTRVPCVADPGAYNAPGLAIDPHGQVWEICLSPPSLGLQRKQLYTSIDLGRHWLRVSPTSASDRLLSEGYVGAFAAPAPSVLLLARARAAPIISRDGGRSWRPTFTAPGAALADASAGWISFADREHGLLGLDYTLVYATDDGGLTWQLVPSVH